MTRGHRPVPSREAGFTLLEIVVALVVLGILLATLSSGTRFGLAMLDRQDRLVAASSRLEAVDNTLRGLIEALDPGAAGDAATLTGSRHALAFRTRLPIPDLAAADPDGTLADLRLVVADHALVLDWLPHRHLAPDGAGGARRQERLLPAVAGLDIDYWSAGAWHPDWHGEAPPALVRLRILFPDGDPRHWPDIVVAPACAPRTD